MTRSSSAEDARQVVSLISPFNPDASAKKSDEGVAVISTVPLMSVRGEAHDHPHGSSTRATATGRV